VLRWKDGLFLPEAGRSSLEQAAREQRVNDTFLAVLRKLIDQQQRVSPRKGPTYAPAMISRHPEGKAYQSHEYAAAMQRLLDAKHIHIVIAGPPSRGRSHLAVSAHAKVDES
jgi:hypothetical protein